MPQTRTRRTRKRTPTTRTHHEPPRIAESLALVASSFAAAGLGLAIFLLDLPWEFAFVPLGILLLVIPWAIAFRVRLRRAERDYRRQMRRA